MISYDNFGLKVRDFFFRVFKEILNYDNVIFAFFFAKMFGIFIE